MAIFYFSRWRLPAILDFWIFFSVRTPKKAKLRHRLIFRRNRSNRSQNMVIFRFFFDFPRWRPSAILDLLCGRLDQPRRPFGGLYHCAKFGWNRYSSFDNMQVLLFRDLGLKIPIHAPKIRIFGGFDPLNGELSHRDPKGHFLAQKHVIWRIGRQNRSTSAGSAGSQG